MKKRSIILIVLLAMLSYATFAQLKVNSTGTVGIGYTQSFTSPELFINGDFDALCSGAAVYWRWNKYGSYNDPIFYASGNYWGYIGKPSYWLRSIFVYEINYNHMHQSSDLNTKTNIRDLYNCLNKIKNIRGIKYDLKPELYDSLPSGKKEEMIESGKDNFGFIAQELMIEFPELVEYSEETGLYSINYTGMIPVLLESIKEQQAIIENLTNEISELKHSNSGNLKSGMLTSDENLNLQEEIPILFQNNPNPFYRDTKVEFYIPEGMNEATLFIYNMQGNQIKSIGIKQRGHGNEMIYGSELTPGMYMYTLIVDGNETDTKRMILTAE